jgi:hypothetical protein
MKENPVILLSSVGNLDGALRLVDQNNPIVICLDEFARQMAAQKAGLQVYSVGAYLDLSETELRQLADEFALQWYQANGTDYSAFE